MSAEARAQAMLAAYVAAVVGITFIHHIGVLAMLLALVVTMAGGFEARAGFRLLSRTLRSVLFFNATVSVGYALVAGWRGDLSWNYLVLINLRVVLLVFMGFWFISRVNVLQALRFSPTLAFVATLASGQAQTFARIVRDFRPAFTSRQVGAERWHDHARHAGAQAAHLLDKAISNATDSAQALRARGCFDD